MKPNHKSFSRRIIVILISMFMMLQLFGAIAMTAEVPRLVVFAAASTTNVMTDISRNFETIHGGKAVLSFAASSMLARQIKNGAPAAVYVSANTKWVNYLIEQGLVRSQNRRVLFSNQLVVIVPADQAFLAGTTDRDLLDYLGDGYLALANPDHTPVGIYARQSLKYLGMWERVQSRIARAKDVRAAMMLVERKASPVGIVYATDAKISKRVTVVTALPTESHSPIVYWCVLVGNEPSSQAISFYKYLRSAHAKRIFKQHGFKTGAP